MIEHFYQDVEGWFDFPHVYREALVRIPHGGSMVEVGVCYGKSFFFLTVEAARLSDAIMQKCDVTFHAVDPFRWPSDVWARFQYNKRLVENLVNIEVHRGLSVPVAKTFDDASQDFVFIDAEHTYEEVKKDIEAWWPKVKPGGAMAGHDWSAAFPGVAKAVNEFACTLGDPRLLRIIRCEAPEERYCWWIEKDALTRVPQGESEFPLRNPQRK
jgi:predicted O-methyltransferase YrrM